MEGSNQTFLENILSQIMEHQAHQVALLERLVEQTTPGANIAANWLDPEQAAAALGLNITKSKSHRVRLSWLRRQGFLTKFRSGNPPKYDRADIEQCAEKIRAGKIHFPSSF